MQKIPTVYERDWNGDRSRVTPQVHTGCEWVVAGEGIATRKYDGQCAALRGGRLYKRHEVKEGKTTPPRFELIGHDPDTGKTIGWVPVGDGPEDRWFREGLEYLLASYHGQQPPDGTFELVGPKVQKNQEGFNEHRLIRHRMADVYVDAPRSYEGLRAFFEENNDIEGLVFHHPDGRMAKIKARDFGLRRVSRETPVAR